MSIFERAKHEYESSDDDEKHRLIYAYFGLAVFESQCLEECFSLMLTTDRIFKRKVKTNREVNENIDSIEQSKKTMGKFINEVKKSYNLPKELKEDLEKLLENRNYLIHKYFKQKIHLVYSDAGRIEMIQYFCNFIDKARETDAKLKSYYSVYTEKMGITDGLIDQMLEDIKTEEKKKDLNNS